jgi:competence protein CoiA
MLIAEGKLRIRVTSTNVTNLQREKIRRLCKRGGLWCPECLGPIEFRAGTSKIAHFAHRRGTTCTYSYWEPESEDHIRGKLLLYEWLSQAFPNSQIALEQSIPETKQRSDILVIHPSGEKIAVEYQCSPIPEDIWQARHSLYKQANIQDLWVISSKLKYIVDDETKGYKCYIKKEFERAILNTFSWLSYLDVHSKLFDIIRNGTFETKTILSGHAHFDDSLNNIRIKSGEPWSNAMEGYYTNNSNLEKLKHNEDLYMDCKKRLTIVNGHLYEIERQELNSHFKELVNKRNQQLEKLSLKETHLFNQLCKKHGYTFKTLPGLFFTQVEHASLIETPSMVWQLWIYDNFIYNQKNIQIKNNRISIYIPSIKKPFIEMVKDGYFRVHKGDRHSHYLFVLYDFAKVLVDINVLSRLSFKNYNYCKIRIDQFLPSRNLEESVLCEWGINKFSHEIPDKIKYTLKSYIEKCRGKN